jgi:hypothetical protein
MQMQLGVAVDDCVVDVAGAEVGVVEPQPPTPIMVKDNNMPATIKDFLVDL